MEHVQNPIDVLKRCKRALKSGGKILITVPNALSLSRQMAQCMGVLDDLYGLTLNDLNHGHRRVYDMKLLIADIETAGFVVLKTGGTFLKQFADFQLDMMMEKIS